jgi:hypothetical protein
VHERAGGSALAVKQSGWAELTAVFICTKRSFLGSLSPLRERDRVRVKVGETSLLTQTKSAVRTNTLVREAFGFLPFPVKGEGRKKEDYT